MAAPDSEPGTRAADEFHRQLIHSCGAMTGEMDLFAIHSCLPRDQAKVVGANGEDDAAGP